jgi:hypothetical protein
VKFAIYVNGRGWFRGPADEFTSFQVFACWFASQEIAREYLLARGYAGIVYPVRSESIMIIYPTKSELVRALESAREDANDCDVDRETGLDVRLQCTEVGWQLHCGLADYDPDHSGVWGADCVFTDSTAEDLTSMADRLLDECRDMEATS